MVKITLWPSAEKDLSHLTRGLRRTILLACHDIFDDWTIGKKLDGALVGYRAHRVGVYRILYKVRKSSSIEIVAIGHRKDIYERVTKGR